MKVQYLLTTVESALVDILSFGLLQPAVSSPLPSAGHADPTRDLRMKIKQLCLELLPQAIGLTDAFSFTDWQLDR